MRSFYRAMLDAREVIYEKRDRPAADAYTEVEHFLKEGSYSSYKKACQLSTLKLMGYGEDFIATQLGVSASTVRTHVSNVSNELYKFFGTNFFDMLSNYAENRTAVDAVLLRIRHAGDMAVSYILSDVIKLVKSYPVESSERFELKCCQQELDLLRRFSAAFLQEAVSRVDMRKLAYLVGILDWRCGTSADWVEVISIIKGESVK